MVYDDYNLRMRLFVLSVFLWSVFLSSCKTHSAVDFFGEDQLGDSWTSSAFSEYLRKLDEKPLSQQKLNEGETIFRFLVLQAGDPIHMIKFKTDQNKGDGTVSIKKTNIGYMLQGSKRLAASNTSRASKEDVSEFLNEIASYEFWLQADEPTYNFSDEILTHPPMFLFEGRSFDKNIGFYDFGGVFRKNTPHLALAFYALADLNEDDDWTYAGYFSEWAKVDWTYTD